MGTPKDISGQEAQVLATNDPKKTEVVEGKERFLTLEEIANKRISKAKK
jgi:hypothetical protein